jgi:microcystin-dependent protein
MSAAIRFDPNQEVLMTDPFLGELALVPYNFAPKGWALCNGQLLPINQNQALFALLGTTYGGDGRVTFALPDLRGRVPISSGQGPGLENYNLGQTGGAEHVTLAAAQMPQHSHAMNVHSGKSMQTTPAGNVLANGSVYTNAASNAVAAASAVVSAGSGQAHENRQPYLTLNWVIALQGTWPSQT